MTRFQNVLAVSAAHEAVGVESHTHGSLLNTAICFQQYSVTKLIHTVQCCKVWMMKTSTKHHILHLFINGDNSID